MRKFTFLLFITIFSISVFAQQIQRPVVPLAMPECGLVKADVGEKISIKPKHKGNKGLKAVGDTIFFEDFSAGVLPAGWSILDQTGNGFDWVVTDQPPGGQFSTNITVMDSVNGGSFMSLQGDMFNTPIPGTGAVELNAYFQTSPINCSAFGSVILNFDQSIRWCCQPNKPITLQVSVDNGTSWTDFDLTQAKVGNQWYEQNLEINLSDVAGNEGSVILRFWKHEASHYFWMVDNILLYAGPEDDMVLEQHWCDEAGYEGGYYSMVPKEQFQFNEFSSAVFSNGSNAADNVTLDVTVVNALGDTIYNAPDDTVILSPLARDTMIVDSVLWFPYGAATGEYTATYELSMDAADEIPENNSAEVDFSITSSVFAHDNERTGRISPFNWINTNDGDQVGCQFWVAVDDTVESISVRIEGTSTPGTFIIGELRKWDAVLGDHLLQIDSDEHLITEDDLDEWIDLPLTSDDGTQEYITGGAWYMAMISFFRGSDTLEISRDGSGDYHRNDQEAIGNFGGQLTLITSVPLVRLNMFRTPACDSIFAQATTTDATCFGAADGTAIISAMGGDGIYTYAWSNGDSLGVVDNLVAGTYEVTVSSCTNTAVVTVTISEPATALIIAETVSIATCEGDGGEIMLEVTGGVQPYTTSWSNGSTDMILTNLNPDDYTYTVVDAGGCEIINTLTVNDPEYLTATITTFGMVSEFGMSDGYINVSITGGIAPYDILWSSGQTTESIAGIPADTYTLVVVDSVGCIDSVTFEITEPILECDLIASITNSTDVTCNGGSDGTATITATSTYTPITYNWDNAETTAVAAGLDAGTHQVTVTDDANCIEYLSVEIMEPGAITATSAVTPETGTNGDGAIDLTVAGGTSPYTYSWSNGSTDEDPTALSLGWYYVTITDNSSCTGTGSFFVWNDNPCAMTISMELTPLLCNGDANGQAVVTATGGTPPYTYEWGNGVTNDTITGLTAGNVIVVVTDSEASACVKVIDTVLSQPAEISITVDSIIEASFGSADGAVYTSVTGGTPPLTYLWDDGAGSVTDDITGLAPGPYNLVVTDANSCTVGISANVTQGSADCSTITLTSSITDVTCFGDSDGQISAVATSVYSTTIDYVWSNASTTSTITGLAVGEYSVTATDSVGCTISDTLSISNPTAALAVSVSVTDAACLGGSNGSIDLTVTGGWTPYSYLWDDSSTDEDLTGLAAGTYDVVITDSLGCMISETGIAVGEPATGMSVVEDVTNTTTCDDSDGSASLVVSDGATPYTYLWSNAQTTATITGLSMGSYPYVVTDASGCTISGSVTLTVPGAPVVTAAVTHETAASANDGAIDVTIINGASPFTFVWAGPSSFTAATEDISGLAPGTYYVTVTDADNCIGLGYFAVFPYDADCDGYSISVSNPGGEIMCYGDATGHLLVNVTGGAPPYTYLWDDENAQTTASATDLSGGYFTCLVYDNNGCPAAAGANIVEPTKLEISISKIEASSPSSSDGEATAVGIGGVAPYSYSWSNGWTADATFGLAVGWHYVTVTDGNACSAIDSVLITKIYEVDPAANIKLYPNPTKGNLTIENAENTTINIYNVIGDLVTRIQITEQVYTINLLDKAEGTYFIQFVTDEFTTTRQIIIVK